MEESNRLNLYCLKEKTARWLVGELGVTPSTLGKWCTNSSQPDVACL